MCFRKRSNESAALRIATMCVIVGITSPYLFHRKNLSHAWCGLLLGFSIAVNLRALWGKGGQSDCGGQDAAGQ